MGLKPKHCIVGYNTMRKEEGTPRSSCSPIVGLNVASGLSMLSTLNHAPPLQLFCSISNIYSTGMLHSVLHSSVRLLLTLDYGGAVTISLTFSETNDPADLVLFMPCVMLFVWTLPLCCGQIKACTVMSQISRGMHWACALGFEVCRCAAP